MLCNSTASTSAKTPCGRPERPLTRLHQRARATTLWLDDQPRQAGKRHDHQQEEPCLSPKLTANMVYPPIGGMRRFGSHPADSHEPA